MTFERISRFRAAACSGLSPDQLRYLPLRIRYYALIALVDGKTGEFLSIVPITSPNG